MHILNTFLDYVPVPYYLHIEQAIAVALHTCTGELATCWSIYCDPEDSEINAHYLCSLIDHHGVYTVPGTMVHVFHLSDECYICTAPFHHFSDDQMMHVIDNLAHTFTLTHVTPAEYIPVARVTHSYRR